FSVLPHFGLSPQPDLHSQEALQFPHAPPTCTATSPDRERPGSLPESSSQAAQDVWGPVCASRSSIFHPRSSIIIRNEERSSDRPLSPAAPVSNKPATRPQSAATQSRSMSAD